MRTYKNFYKVPAICPLVLKVAAASIPQAEKVRISPEDFSKIIDEWHNDGNKLNPSSLILPLFLKFSRGTKKQRTDGLNLPSLTMILNPFEYMSPNKRKSVEKAVKLFAEDLNNPILELCTSSSDKIVRYRPSNFCMELGKAINDFTRQTITNVRILRSLKNRPCTDIIQAVTTIEKV